MMVGRSGISLVLHVADDFGGQAFHLPGFFEEQVEQDKLSSCVCDRTQASNAG